MFIISFGAHLPLFEVNCYLGAVNTTSIAWILLFGFAVFNTFAVYRVLKGRDRLDLMWIPTVCSLVPIILFALWPNPIALLSFPLLQSAGMLIVQKMASKEK